MEQQIEQAQAIYDTIVDLGIRYGFQVFGAILILVIGIILANICGRITKRICVRTKLDITLTKFFVGVVKTVVLGLALIVAMAKFGITIAPMVAAIGAGAFGLSLAIQGPVSNYGAGLALIITRPFKVGDTLTLHSLTGIVEEIKLGATILTTEDGEQITIPNKHVLGEIFINSFPNKVVEGSIGIAYSADPEQAVDLIRECLQADENVSRESPVQVGIEAFADSSINIAYRYWVKTEVYYQTAYRINMAIFKAFQEHEVAIPFPQREVRILNEPTRPSMFQQP
mgnify:CR=1 FL=1